MSFVRLDVFVCATVFSLLTSGDQQGGNIAADKILEPSLDAHARGQPSKRHTVEPS